jgi:nucleotide-binding universal stress UspA family protein
MHDTDDETKATALKLGAKGFLQKPFRRKELVDKALRFAALSPEAGLKKILVPFDYSDPAIRALRFGLSLAQEYQAKLMVVHVVPSLAAFVHGNEIEKLERTDEEKALNAAISPICRDFGNLHPSVKVGDVHDEIVRIIHDERISLVVMGTHGRGNLGRLFLGSTTENLLREIPVPVVTVTDKDPGDASSIRSIVYATDLSGSAEHGLHYAADLARTLKAELKLLHVVDTLESGAWAGWVPGAIPFVFSDIQAQAETRLRQALKTAACDDIHASVHVIEGRSQDAILRFAQEQNADLLVMNLKRKGTLERLMMGATAESVVRGSHIPVLSVPVEATVSLVPADPPAIAINRS